MRPPVVLAYHGVGYCDRSDDPHNLFLTPDAFERQMEHLAGRYQVVSLHDAVQDRGSSAQRQVAITFDDAYVGVLTYAVPVLARLRFPATVFLPTAFLGASNTWDPPSGCDQSIMDADQCRSSLEMGLSIESHGHAHIDMATASPEEIRNDLQTSADSIASLTGRRPRFLAYPFGRHSPAARQMAQESGLEAAFTIDAPHAGRYAWWRIQVTPLDGSALFRAKVRGLYGALRWSPIPAAGYRMVAPVVRRLRS